MGSSIGMVDSQTVELNKEEVATVNGLRGFRNPCLPTVSSPSPPAACHDGHDLPSESVSQPTVKCVLL